MAAPYADGFKAQQIYSPVQSAAVQGSIGYWGDFAFVDFNGLYTGIWFFCGFAARVLPMYLDICIVMKPMRFS